MDSQNGSCTCTVINPTFIKNQLERSIPYLLNINFGCLPNTDLSTNSFIKDFKILKNKIKNKITFDNPFSHHNMQMHFD